MSESPEDFESPAPGRYTVPIDVLENGVRVAREDQVEDQPTGVDDDSSWAWNEAERQLRLAGGR